MRHSNRGAFRQQVSFLRRQFLQDGGLPFTDVLTQEGIEQALTASNTTWLDRIFSPLVTLWVFLGQVLSGDQSCRAAVARLIAHRFADELVFRYTGEQGIARTKIAYVSEQKGARELFVMDYDGHDPRQVTADGYLNLMPRWSADRRFLIFTAYRSRNTQDIDMIELATGKRWTLISKKGLNITPALSPDGNYLAFASSGTVTEVLVKEGDLVQAGQPLAHLDDRDLQLQISSAQASLQSAQAHLLQAQQGNATPQDIAAAQAGLANDQANLQQTRNGNSTAADIASAQAQLRSAQARWSGEPRFDALLTDLGASPDFTSRWAAHGVTAPDRGVVRLVHPAIGELRFGYETLAPADYEYRLVSWIPSDPASERALDAFLAHEQPVSPARLRVVGGS